MCCGDFNEILFNCEKEGGAIKPEGNMLKFREVLEECDLHDLGFVGEEHIWWKLNLRENSCKPRQKSHLNSQKNHTCR